MAPPFMVSAPGKVIVYGEHAAVFGQPAIAAAISLRSYLPVTTLSKSRRTVKLNFTDIGVNHTWDISSLPWSLFDQPSKRQPYNSLAACLDPELFDAVIPHAEEVSPDLPEKQRQVHVRSAAAFLYLFLSLGSPESPGFIYTLRSTIPVGAGLGSSASVCVCLSTALLLQNRALSAPHPDQPLEEANVQIDINRWAFVGELCIHGDPSGVDNTISTGGRAAIFQRNDPGPPSVTPLTKFPELPILLVDTRTPRSTSDQVSKVKSLKMSQPTATDAILDSIGKVTTASLESISTAVEDGITHTVESLGTLMRVNHGLLVSLGVSHPRLERIRELVDYTGIGWAKLTGAGGGGCAIILFRPDVETAMLKDLDDNFTTEGFQTHRTVLGANGVGVLWPAVFRNDEKELVGEEINQERFENAVGTEGLEQLVGVSSHAQSNRVGWKFWSRASA